jgi:TonB family protein
MGILPTKDVSRPSTAAREKPTETSNRRPVCIEVPVTVHGDRLSEPTRTVIVFSDGAVLRLVKAANPGQLVFLTNEHTKESIVCRVVASKTYPNVAGFIELAFTRPSPAFWGIHFPGGVAESQSASAATVRSQVPSQARPSPSAAPHSPLPSVSPRASAPASINPVPLAEGITAAEHSPAPVAVSSPPARPPAPAIPALIPPDVAPWMLTQGHAPAATDPYQDAEIAAFISRLMFEQPETPELIQAARRPSVVIPLIAAGLLLAALAGGGWLLWRHRAHETVANLSPRSANVTAVMSAPSPTNPSVSAEQPAESLERPNAASEKPAAISHFRLLKPHAKRALSSAKNREVAGIDSVPALPPPLQGPGTLVGVSGSQPAAPEAARLTLNKVKTAHLISSVPPVYPPLALSLRVEGDVTLDALIEENGRITTIKVLSGPTVLQQAAVVAVRQWKYEPATLNGSPTPIHLSVTVRFHLP